MRGESQSAGAKDPEIPGVFVGNYGHLEGCEGSLRERDFKAALVRGRAQETKRPKGAKAPTWTKPPGAKRGTAKNLGCKPLERR